MTCAQTLTGLLSLCLEVGPIECALAAPKDGSQTDRETVASLLRRLDALYSQLQRQPLAVGNSRAGPGIVQASDIQYLIVRAYTGVLVCRGTRLVPYRKDSKLTIRSPHIVLVDLEQGDSSTLYTLMGVADNLNPKPYNEVGKVFLRKYVAHRDFFRISIIARCKCTVRRILPSLSCVVTLQC